MSNKLYVLGRGRVFFDAFASGTQTLTGERYFGNTPSFSLTAEPNSLDHFDADGGIKVKDDTALLELIRNGQFVTDNIDPENVALFLLGTTSTLTQAAATGQTYAIANPQVDRYYQIGAAPALPAGVRGITNAVLTKGSTELQVGTDYDIDLTLARVYLRPDGAGGGPGAISVAYDLAAGSRSQIITAANATIDGALRFISNNPKGPQRDYYMPSVQLAPNGEYQLKGDEWQQIGFTISIQKLNDATESIYSDGRPFAP